MTRQKLSVIIVGGGIGGLAAAVALRRAGHSVKVFERGAGEEIGAGIILGPAAIRILDSWGFDAARAQQRWTSSGEFLNGDSFEPMVPLRDYTHFPKSYGAPQRSSYRVDLHTELARLASQVDGPGPAADVLTKSPVTNYDTARGTVTLGDGSEHKADLVVAANGVHSPAGRLINGDSCPRLRVSATTIIRFMIPTSTLKADPVASKMLPSDPERTSVYIGPSGGRYLIRYGCRDGTLQNFSLYSLENEELADAQQLRFSTDRAALRRELDGFHATFLRLTDMASEILSLWRCSSRDVLDAWSVGRFVVLGDAAHPMLPNLGLGAMTAIEDAEALGVALGEGGPENGPQGDLDAWLAERLRIYERVRKGRTAVYKLYSDIPAFRDPVVEQRDESLQFLKEDELPADFKGLQRWQWGYDVKAHAKQVLVAAKS